MIGRQIMHPLSRRRFLKLSSALALGAALRPLGLAGCSHAQIERAAYTMGAIVTIKAFSSDEALCHRAIDEAFLRMKSVDAAMSVYASSSELSALNREASGRPMPCSEELLSILEAAAGYAQRTDGAFDVTIQPLMELYGFRDAHGAGHFPTDREIAAVLESVGMRNVLIDRGRSSVAFSNPRTSIDLGGIAVGHALDAAAAVLRSRGITCALINHSGDLYAIGAPPFTDGWEIGITDPLHTDGIVATTFIRDEALSTSGNYRNIRELQGRTIGHILDPGSGRCASSLLSSTVVAGSAIAADALATGTFVMGKERSEALLREMNSRMISVSRDPADPRRSLASAAPH